MKEISEHLHHTVCIERQEGFWAYWYVDRNSQRGEIWKFPSTLKEAMGRAQRLGWEIYYSEKAKWEKARERLLDEDLSLMALRARQLEKQGTVSSGILKFGRQLDAEFEEAQAVYAVTPEIPRIAVATEPISCMQGAWLFMDNDVEKEKIYEMMIEDSERVAVTKAIRSTNLVWAMFGIPLVISFIFLLFRFL